MTSPADTDQGIAPASFLYLYLACTHRSQRVRVAEAELVSA